MTKNKTTKTDTRAGRPSKATAAGSTASTNQKAGSDREVLECVRERRDGKWHQIHRTADGRVTIDAGPDDQRPLADGRSCFQPICIAEVPHWTEQVWQYHYYCGRCRKRMGEMGSIREHCPRCGAEVGHYLFSMGILKFQKTDRESMPDLLPENLPVYRV